MSYLCDDRSVVHRKDSLHTNTCRYKYGKRSAPLNDLRYDAYQLKKLAGMNTDVVPMRRRKCRTWGRQSTTNIYVGTNYGKRSAPSNDLQCDVYQLEKLAGTNTDVVLMRQRKRRTWGRQSTTNTYVGTDYGTWRHHQMTFDAMPTNLRS